MGLYAQILSFLLFSVPLVLCQVTEFISIDCGGTSNYTDPSTGLAWTSDNGIIINHGKSVSVSNPAAAGDDQQYRNRRDFPTDDNKYCYTLPTQERRRYILRATFLWGNTVDANTYPKFQLFLDATKWATITVVDGERLYVEEMIIRAPSSSVDICVCCATTGSPFISTLELRPLNLSMYATDYEDSFYLKVAARINFGASTKNPVRYPDDPYDRIWESDLDKRQNYLVGEAPGTERITTSKTIDVNTREYPPVQVMQTAVEGTQGSLTYRLNLEDFPANARAFAYFAEIEDLRSNESRKFNMKQPYVPDYSSAVVNIAENANGKFRLYEPSYMNVSLEFVLSFSFVKTPDSTKGPLLNAIEISKYVQIGSKADIQDVISLKTFKNISPPSVYALNQGDPCSPKAWSWVVCSSTSPPRVTEIHLSRMNLTGSIPSELNNMDSLTELWLNDNTLSGPMPDISNLISLKILHLENNRLTGSLPSYLGSLPSLQELYIQNNYFSGKIPPGLLSRQLVAFEYEGNSKLTQGTSHSRRLNAIVIFSVAAFIVVILLLLGSFLLLRKYRRKRLPWKNDVKGHSSRGSTKPSSAFSLTQSNRLRDEGVTCQISLSDIEEATANFLKNIGKGSFGPVYYGRMKDGKEVAVKIMADPSSQGPKQFVTEVSLLSRIHHRNLVPLIGYCEEATQRILVYEYMHNGTLRDHIHNPVMRKNLDWLSRLTIAEDAAKGLEYLHTGCNPSIIHRDVKTSNILLDRHMRAKVSDFGLSRTAEEDVTHVSSVARGTLGYVDPEYYAYQMLTEKSDVYSFGIVLLELISGRRPVTGDYGPDWNMVHWARSLIRKGDVVSMIDPFLVGSVKLESVWRVTEVAIQCIEPRGVTRPKMQEIIIALQDAVKIEKAGSENEKDLSTTSNPRVQSTRKTLLTSFLEVESSDISRNLNTPSAR